MLVAFNDPNKDKVSLIDTKDNVLLNAFYNSAFIVEDEFDKHSDIKWKDICQKLDSYCNSETTKINIKDMNFVSGAISGYYGKRINDMYSNGEISHELATQRIQEFSKINFQIANEYNKQRCLGN